MLSNTQIFDNVQCPNSDCVISIKESRKIRIVNMQTIQKALRTKHLNDLFYHENYDIKHEIIQLAIIGSENTLDKSGETKGGNDEIKNFLVLLTHPPS